MPETRTLYALLVGIDQYLHYDNLRGCVNDVGLIEEYIQSQLNVDLFELKLLKLANKEATKEKIIGKFRSHLGQAQIGDIALFYYAGLGGLETKHTAFQVADRKENDEALICYNSKTESAAADLNLREIQFLIEEITAQGSECITIYDSSFGKNGKPEEGAGVENLPGRSISAVKPTRMWDEFLFGKHMSVAAFQHKQKLGVGLRSGAHIHLGACAKYEQALEIPGQDMGMFTKSLVACLNDSKGSITYQQLNIALKHKLKEASIHPLTVDPQNITQTPQLHITGLGEEASYRPFLDNAFNRYQKQVQLSYDADLNAWKIPLGSMHGIPIQKELRPIVAVDSRPAEVELGKVEAEIVEVFPAQAVVKFPAGRRPFRHEMVQGQIKRLCQNRLQVYLQGDEEGVALLESIVNESANIDICPHPSLSDYIVQAKKNAYHFHHFSHHRPLISKIDGYGPASAEEVGYYLRHIARWEYIRRLYNPHFTLSEDGPVSMEIYRLSAENLKSQLVPSRRGKINWQHQEMEDGYKLRFTIKLVNRSNQKLYCSLLYMSQTFWSLPHILENGMVTLDPGEMIWALGGKPIEFVVPPYIKAYNWRFATDIFKLIISANAFDPTHFHLAALAPPEVDGQVPSLSSTFSHGEISTETLISDYWATRNVEIQTLNPYFTG